MHRVAAWTAGALCIALASFVPITAHSEMPEQPDTPLVTVAEIGFNWVKVQGLVVQGTTTTEQALQGAVGLDPSGFDPGNIAHIAQARDLGDYVCRLNNRRGVLLSQVIEDSGYAVPDYFYLVACALP
ncbi:MAG: hypothetical protein OXK73_04025 [Rhodospirillaceae bacterium]|nr:hypothetical protein [Rhodospirillaceae bacterium]